MLQDTTDTRKIYYNSRLNYNGFLEIYKLREEDEVMFIAFLKNLSNEALFQRFNHYLTWDCNSLHSAFTEVLNAKLNLVALVSFQEEIEIVGVLDLVQDKDKTRVEYAIVILDEWQHQGIGSLLTEIAFREAKKLGIQKIYAYTTFSNTGMKKIFKKFNFSYEPNFQHNEVYVEKTL